jgi:hypothetical protein
MVRAIYAMALIIGLVCTAFALGVTWLLIHYSGSILIIFPLPLIPLVVNIIYLVWVIKTIAVRARRNELYERKSWVLTLFLSLVVVSYNYLLYGVIASWHL